VLHHDLGLKAQGGALSGSLGADIAGSTGTSPVRTAMNGNLSRVAEVFGTGDESDPVAAMLNRDNNWTFAMFPPPQ
jgi:hypothetical protein